MKSPVKSLAAFTISLLILASCATSTRDVSGSIAPNLPTITPELKIACVRAPKLPADTTYRQLIEDSKATTRKLNACADKHGALVAEIEVLYSEPDHL